MTLFSVVALFLRDGKVLANSRKTDHEDLGLPGGKIDPGESPETALIRELDEEIGVVPTNFEVIFEDLDRVEGLTPKPCRTYLVSAWDGEPLSKEGTRVVWVPPGRLLEPSCMFHDYNRKLFEAIGLK